MPLYVVRDGVPARHVLPFPENTHLYTDEAHSASVLVRNGGGRTAATDLDVTGSVTVDGKDYVIGDVRRIDRKLRNRAGRFSSRGWAYGTDFVSSPARKSSANWRTADRRLRSRRAADGDHVIELLMVADVAVYTWFVEWVGGDPDAAKMEMLLYYTFIATSMNSRYVSVQDSDPDLSIHIKPVGLVITEPGDSLTFRTEDYTSADDVVDADAALFGFSDWRSKQQGLPVSDHAMLFTGREIQYEGSTFAVGLAYYDTLCDSFSASIIEEYFDGQTAKIAAHELGHSISARHDGEYKSCHDDDYYVMGAYLGIPRDSRRSNPWIFSPCSISAFREKLAEVSCTRSTSGHVMLESGKRAGQHYSPDDQCVLAMGPGSYLCRSFYSNWTRLCGEMMCKVPSLDGTCRPILPLDFTSCGPKEWCEKGNCVRNDAAPELDAKCPHGDVKGFDCTDVTCSADVKDACCSVCGVVNVTPGQTSGTADKSLLDLIVDFFVKLLSPLIEFLFN